MLDCGDGILWIIVFVGVTQLSFFPAIRTSSNVLFIVVCIVIIIISPSSSITRLPPIVYQYLVNCMNIAYNNRLATRLKFSNMTRIQLDNLNNLLVAVVVVYL